MGLGAAAVMPQTLSIISNVFDPGRAGRVPSASGPWRSVSGWRSAPWWAGCCLAHFLVGLGVPAERPVHGRRCGRRLAGGPRVEEPGPRQDRLRGRAGLHRGPGAPGLRHHPGWGEGFLGARRPCSARSSPGSQYSPSSPGTSAGCVTRRWTSGCSANPRLSSAVGALALVFFGLMGALFFLSFYLQSVRGYSPRRRGCSRSHSPPGSC